MGPSFFVPADKSRNFVFLSFNEKRDLQVVMKYQYLILFMNVFTIAFFCGCRSSKQRTFKTHISHVRAHGAKELHLDASQCSGKICAHELGFDITKEGFVMIRIRLVNRGGDTYIFRPSYADVLFTSQECLEEFFLYDTSTRCIWLSLPSVFYWWPAVPLVVVPCGLMWSRQNEQISHILSKKLIGPETEFKISPYETVEKIFFVPAESWYGNFTLGFYDKKTNELVNFTVEFSEKA